MQLSKNLLYGSSGWLGPGGPFFSLYLFGCLFFSAMGAAHPGHHSSSSRLTEDAISHHLKGEHYTLLVEYNPFPHTRRAELVLAVFDAGGGLNLDAELVGLYYPNDDEASTKSLFIRIDGADPRLKVSRPLVEVNREYTLKFLVAENEFREEFTISNFAAIPVAVESSDVSHDSIPNQDAEVSVPVTSSRSQPLVLFLIASLIILPLFLYYWLMRKKKH
jgi:hypothetical protein